MTSDTDPDPDLAPEALGERDRLVDRLTELIKTATDAELDYIADADPTAGPIQIAKHQAALRTIIHKRDGRMTEKHTLHPGEAISAVAEDGEEHLDRAFEIATAVLMINALLGDDADGAMSLCWAENGPVYSTVDPEFLEPLLFGFRWLAEHATDWDFPHGDGTEPVPERTEIAALAGATEARPAPRKVAPDGLG